MMRFNVEATLNVLLFLTLKDDMIYIILYLLYVFCFTFIVLTINDTIYRSCLSTI